MHDQIRRYATELAAPRASTRPRATSHGRVSRTDRRRPRRWLLLAALVIAIAASVFALLKPAIVNTGTGAARLALSTAQVKIGGNKSSDPVFERHPPGSYTITVTGLTSGRTASAGLQVITGTIGAVNVRSEDW